MRPLLTDLRGNPIYSFAQRRLRRMRLHPSTLICLIKNRAWDEFLRRIRRYPAEALYQDEVTGNTPLHVACRLDPPPNVIRALQAVSRKQNHEGATPLHIAASHRCSALCMKALIDCASDQMGPDGKDVSPTTDLSRMGRAPIHYACMSFRGLQIDAFKILFEESLKKGNLIMNADKQFELDEEFGDGTEVSFDDFNSTTDGGSQVEVNVLGVRDATGQTPLALLFRRYRERVKLVIRTVDRLHRQHKDSPNKAALAAAMTVHADLGGLWERAGWIIARLSEERMKRENTTAGEIGCCSPISREAASWATERLGSTSGLSAPLKLVGKRSRVRLENATGVNCVTYCAAKSTPRFRIVHASVGLTGYGCPPEMIRLALSLHPHQVREMDENGCLPIHIAATASSFLTNAEEASPTVMAAAVAAATDITADDMSVISEAMSFFSSATVSQTTNPFDKVIKLLLDHYPEGARVPHGESGSLPLVLAIESKVRTWEDGIRSLMNAFPPALHSKKVITPALYPEVLAIVANSFSDSETVDLGTHRSSSRNKRLRQEAGARSTLFELIRTRPDLLFAGRDEIP